MPLNNDDFSKFVEWVREHRLPMHVTIPDLDKLLGPSTDTFLTTLCSSNHYQKISYVHRFLDELIR